MKNERFSMGQLLALCSVASLTPALRILPSAAAAAAGRGAWLSVLLALPGALLLAFFLWRFGAKRREGEDFGALWLRAAGPVGGRAALGLLGLWLLFYAAFTLRAGAERLRTTVFPAAGLPALILPAALAAGFCSLGEAKRLARMGKLLQPLLFGALLLTLALSLPLLDGGELLPLGAPPGALLRGSLPALDTAALLLTLFFLLEDSTGREGGFRALAGRLGLLAALMALLCAALTARFGPALTARLTRPYFSLVRDLVLLRDLERPEALLVALWQFADFLLAAALLIAARRCLRPLPGDSRALGVGAAAGVTVLALLLAPSAESYRLLSETLIPALNLAMSLLPAGAVYLAGRLRRRI